MNKNISVIYNLIQELAWYFGNQGFDGECCENLSLVEFMALKKIYEKNNLSIQEIGIALNFTKSGATRIIDRLENKGYVTRERSPLDGRVCCVTITEEGTVVTIRIIKKYTVYLEEKLRELEPQMVDNIQKALEILIKAVQY